MNQLLVFLEEEFLYIKKYKMSSFIWPFIIVPIISILDIVFRSEYIKLVEFYNKTIPYLYILLVGGVASSIFVDLTYRFGYSLLDTEFLKSFYLFNKVIYFISKVFFHIIKEAIRISIIYSFIYVLYKLPIKFLLFSILILVLVIPFSLSVSLLVSTIILRFKKDAEPLMWIIESISGIIFPISFSILIFPDSIRKYLEIFIPSFAIVEETRKVLILNNFSVLVLLLSLIVSFLYLFLSIIVFRLAYNKGRKEGWLYLS